MVTTFTRPQVLWHFHDDRELIIETETSDNETTGVLSQYSNEGVLHPAVYLLKQNTLAYCHHDIYDKELLTIIKVLEV